MNLYKIFSSIDMCTALLEYPEKPSDMFRKILNKSDNEMSLKTDEEKKSTIFL